MKIAIRELSDEPKFFKFNQAQGWVNDALLSVDEKWKSLPPSLAERDKKKPREIEVEFELRLVDEIVVTEGKLNAKVNLICSRCAKDFVQVIDERYTSLLTKDPVMAGMDFERNTTGHQASEAATFQEDGEISLLEGDQVDLSQILSEQLVLKVPLKPLCHTECKGICPQCGTDLNRGRCACKKIVTENAFSVLKDFPVVKKNKNQGSKH